MASKRRLLGFAVALSVGPATLAACTNDSHPPIEDVGPSYPAPAAGNAGSTDAGAVSCYGSDAGCNDLSLCGEKIYVTEVAQAAPTGTGGTIAPGLYSMTKYTIYTGTGGSNQTLSNWFKETLTLASGTGASDAGTDADAGLLADAGGDAGAASTDAGTAGGTFVWQDVSESNDGATANGSGVVVTSGTSLAFELECASASSLSGTYTATSGGFIAYYDDPGTGTAAVTFSLMQ
jgi:hypothetical protein